MKKYFIIAAAITALVACQKNEVKTIAPEVDNAIGFSAYTGTAVTKGKQAEADSIKKTGIGVFAFYQPAVGGAKSDFTTRKYATPDYMYNQQVTFADPKWTYSPIKYWPNNDKDQLSFFAYAPYKETVTWEDLNVSTDINGTVITQTFSIDPDPASQIDLLWTAPQVNLTKQKVAEGAGDTGQAATPIKFQFTHVLSQINLKVGVEQNKNEKEPSVWTDSTTTTIVVNSIAFNGVYDTYTCEYKPTTTPKDTTWTASGSQNVVMTSANFQNNTSASWKEAKFYDLTKEGSTLFLAPQKDIEIVINYTVTTTDAKLPGGKSVITNNIAKKLIECTTLTDGFEAGNAYILNFLIGMNQVTLSAEVADWNDVDAQQIDVPANL